jgi:hypothetical protein
MKQGRFEICFSNITQVYLIPNFYLRLLKENLTLKLNWDWECE